MILNGTLWLSVKPDQAVEGFHDPDILCIFLPSTSHLTRTGPGVFDFVVIKETGLVTLKLPGSLTITPEDTGHRFNATAKHILGGSATLLLHLEFAAQDGGTLLTYDGSLLSTGLAARLFRDRADQAQEVIDAKFAAVKTRLEARYRPAGV